MHQTLTIFTSHSIHIGRSLQKNQYIKSIQCFTGQRAGHWGIGYWYRQDPTVLGIG